MSLTRQPMSDFHRLRPDADEKLRGLRFRVSAECAHEVEIAHEIVQPEQVDNPEARVKKRINMIIVMRAEAVWLRDALNAWLVEHPDEPDGDSNE